MGAKKILFLANHFITLFSFRNELIIRLVQAGHRVLLSLPESESNSYYTDLGCTVIPTEINRKGKSPLEDLRLLSFYSKLISETEPDLIFSYTVKPNIYGCLAHGKEYKQICNITGLGGTFSESGYLKGILKVLYRISVKNAYKVFFQNSGDRDFFIKNKLIRDNFELIPGSGCNLAEHPFQPLPTDGIFRFLFMSRVMRLKGIDTYLEAAKIVKAKYPHAEFIIAGWIEQEQYIKIIKAFEREGIVRYIGFRRDVNECFARASCVVLPSFAGEGISNVLLEASATGRPCIGTKIDGIANVIEDGVTGFLFPAGNAAELAERMERLLCMSPEETAEMGRRGRRKIEREFDREIVIEKYMSEVARL